MNKDWITTWEALKAVYVDEAYSNMAINEAIERHDGCSTGFVRVFAKGVIRDTIKLDYYIDKLAEKGVSGIKARTLIILRMGLYAIESLDSVPDYAAVNETVSLAKSLSRGSDRFVNAIMRSFLRKRDELSISDDNLSLRYSFPEELTELLEDQYGDEAESIIKGLSEPPALVIRSNILKNSRKELKDLLAAEGITTKESAESDIALICEGGNILNTECYRQGRFSVQSLSSIMSVESFLRLSKDAPDCNRILDMCAAPGGKSAEMAELTGDDASITACDVYEHRLGLIDATAERLGIKSITAVLHDGTEHVAEYVERFGRVLADVPCSGLGAVATKPELKIRTRTEDYAELEDIQYKILMNAISYTVPGGYIEYSTCTLNRDENERLVDKVLKDCKLAHIVENSVILPYNNKIGFYKCILQRNVL